MKVPVACGRLAEVTVKEGDEVTAGQAIARISSPEYEAQLRAAQAQVLRARQALAEAEALIAQRKSDQVLARTEADRLERSRAAIRDAPTRSLAPIEDLARDLESLERSSAPPR